MTKLTQEKFTELYAEAYESALCKARETVSENSPEFENLLERLTDEALDKLMEALS